TLKGALTYVYQYTEDPLGEDSVWISQNSTLSKITITDLQPGKKYWVRVIAYGRNEQEVISDPVLSRLVQ
ncbi:MAG: fibronectin type III domain-containing protein, partial [Flavisolibacter sp.]